jgi:hypothetical protein
MYHYRSNTTDGAFPENDADSFARDWNSAEPEREDQAMNHSSSNDGVEFGAAGNRKGLSK